MTFAEIERYFASRKRTREDAERRQAYFDYVLADLIGRSVGRIYNKSNKLPAIHEVYPTLFEAEQYEEKLQQKRAEAFAANLKQFSLMNNAKFAEVSENK